MQIKSSSRNLFFIFCAAIFGAPLAGCPEPPPRVEHPKQLGPEDNSGPDAHRAGATPIVANRPDDGEVSWPKGDRTDWKMLVLTGKLGTLAVQLHWDNAWATLDLDVYDEFGTQIGTAESAEGQTKNAAIEIAKLGTYFIRVQAHGDKDGSPYELIARWAGDEELIALPESRGASRPAHAGAPRPAREKPVNTDGGVQGRIVSSYKEGDATMLHIDKGAAAGLRVGSVGTILEGASGETPLDGGRFTIVKVVDDGRSVGKTNLKTLGRNTRVVIQAGK